MPKNSPLIDQINEMSDDEVRALNEKLAKKLVKRIALSAAGTVAVIVVARLVEKKLSE